MGSGGAALASGVTVAVTVGEVRVAGEVTAAGEVAAVSGAVPGAGGTAGATVVPGATATEAPGAAASGAVERAGDAATPAGAASAGLVAGEAAGSWAKAVSAMEAEHRLTISVFFILSRLMVVGEIMGFGCFIAKQRKARPAKLFGFFSAAVPHTESSMNRIRFCCGM